MLILRKMRWSNTFSYGPNNEIDFTKSTVSQIIGKNGHGKSTIAHILEELLYSKNSKGYKKAAILNRYSNSKTWTGSVEFEKDGDLYYIEVTRSPTSQKVILAKNGEDISQHTSTGTYELIEELFGRDFKLFSQLIYQNSRSSLQFLTATDTVRKKFLVDLLNLEQYLIAHESMKEALKSVTGDLNIFKGEMISLENGIKTNKAKNLSRVELKELIQVPSHLLQKYSEQSELLNQIDINNALIEKNNQYKSMLLSIDPQSLIFNIDKIDNSNLINEKAKLNHIIKHEQEVSAKIIKLQNICPTCEQSIDDTFKNNLLDKCKEAINSANKRLTEINSLLKEIEVNNKKYEKIQNDILSFERYSNLINKELPNELYDRKQLEIEVNNLKTEIDDLIKQSNDIIKWNTEASANNSKLEMIKELIATATAELAELKEKVVELETTINHLDILKRAFSTNGLIAYKLEYSVKELENLTNEYLYELSDGRFQLIYAVVGDKLNIIVKDNNIDVEIDALSSGELARVTTATLLAIRKLLSSLSKNNINVLFLDETIDTLDEEGKERLVEVLLKETDLNTFIVSHMYSHPLLNKIIVSKENGFSRLEQL